MSDFKRSLKSSSPRLAAGIFGQMINTFGQIAVVPLFLHYWTKRSYGEWLVLTAVPNLLWSLEGGLAGLAVNRMVINSALGDWKGANRLFQNIFVIQMLVSVVLILLGGAFAEEVNFRPVFRITEMSRGEAGFVLVVMLCYMLLGWCISLLRAPYFAAQRSARGYMMTNFWRLSDFLVICLMLVMHGRASAVAEGEVIVAGAWVLLAFVDIRRTCPEFEFGLRDLSWDTTKSIFHDGVPLLLGQVGNAFFLQGYPLVLGRTLGTLAVVNFTAIRTVTRAFLQGILIVTSSASLELTSSYAKKQWDLYLKWLKLLAAGVLVGCILACVMLTFAGPTFIAIWTHGKVIVSGPILLLFGISVALQAGWSLFNVLLYTANRHHVQYSIYFAITTIALIVGNFTIGRFGFVSVPILMICADLLVFASSVYLSVRTLKEVDFTGLFAVLTPSFYIEKLGWAWSKAKDFKFNSGRRSAGAGTEMEANSASMGKPR